MRGIGYFFRGLRLLNQPGIRPFVIMPVLVNILIFVLLTGFLVTQFDALLNWLVASLGDWFEWLLWLMWLLFAALWLVVYGYSFTLISHILASPFYGLLAERVEKHLTGQLDSTPMTWKSMVAIARRSVVRELQKLVYFMPRLLALVIVTLILILIPGISALVPAIYFLWGAWSLSLENLDFAADNRGVSFADLRKTCARQRRLTLSFGAVAVAGSSIPLLNLLAVPAAVAGGTALWLEHLEANKPDSVQPLSQ